jgi:hypothetical protein
MAGLCLVNVSLGVSTKCLWHTIHHSDNQSIDKLMFQCSRNLTREAGANTLCKTGVYLKERTDGSRHLVPLTCRHLGLKTEGGNGEINHVLRERGNDEIRFCFSGGIWPRKEKICSAFIVAYCNFHRVESSRRKLIISFVGFIYPVKITFLSGKTDENY